jgi:hypothetical protein
VAFPASNLAQKAASRLKFPQLFAVILVLFVFDLFVPDFIPFVDEILLGLAAALFGMWREKVATPPETKPPTKNVTPSP